MWPLKIKTEWVPKEKPVPEIKKVTDEALDGIKLIVKHRVTRVDETAACLKALIELHPEIKEHSAVVDYKRRKAEYQAEKAKQN